MATPPPDMTLWKFFKPAENVLVNKEKALQQGRSASRRRQLYTKNFATCFNEHLPRFDY